MKFKLRLSRADPAASEEVVGFVFCREGDWCVVVEWNCGEV